MGREIEEEPAPLPAEDESFDMAPPLSRREALVRMRDTLSNMREELSEADRYAARARHKVPSCLIACFAFFRSIEGVMFDERAYAILQEQCAAAARSRDRLVKSLQQAQAEEGQLQLEKSKSSLFRGKAQNGAAVAALVSFFLRQAKYED